MASDSASDMIHLSTQTMAGDDVPIGEFNDSDRVYQLKERASVVLSVPLEVLQLFHEGTFLQDDHATLHAVGLVAPSATVMVIQRPLTNAESLRLFLKFEKAVDEGRFDEARALAHQGAGHDAEGNVLRNHGCTIMHLAVRARMEELALYLIEYGIDLEDKNGCGRTPLLQSILKKLPQITDALLAAGADVNTVDSSFSGRVGSGAVEYALRAGDEELVLRLLTLGAKPPQNLTVLSTMPSAINELTSLGCSVSVLDVQEVQCKMRTIRREKTFWSSWQNPWRIHHDLLRSIMAK